MGRLFKEIVADCMIMCTEFAVDITSLQVRICTLNILVKIELKYDHILHTLENSCVDIRREMRTCLWLMVSLKILNLIFTTLITSAHIEKKSSVV